MLVYKKTNSHLLNPSTGQRVRYGQRRYSTASGRPKTLGFGAAAITAFVGFRVCQLLVRCFRRPKQLTPEEEEELLIQQALEQQQMQQLPPVVSVRHMWRMWRRGVIGWGGSGRPPSSIASRCRRALSCLCSTPCQCCCPAADERACLSPKQAQVLADQGLTTLDALPWQVSSVADVVDGGPVCCALCHCVQRVMPAMLQRALPKLGPPRRPKRLAEQQRSRTRAVPNARQKMQLQGVVQRKALTLEKWQAAVQRQVRGFWVFCGCGGWCGRRGGQLPAVSVVQHELLQTLQQLAWWQPRPVPQSLTNGLSSVANLQAQALMVQQQQQPGLPEMAAAATAAPLPCSRASAVLPLPGAGSGLLVHGHPQPLLEVAAVASSSPEPSE